VIDDAGHVCGLRATSEGQMPEKRMADRAGSTFPPGSGLDQEMGFQGGVLAGLTIVQPKKTPRGGELTPPEQATNRRISSIRIHLEHAIGWSKIPSVS
jgi:hypothetical protein